ncbi:MAG: TM2 domain-containing protein [Acidimicrobiia bacterium]
MASYRRAHVRFEVEGKIYRVLGGGDLLFFLPDSDEQFRLDWEGPKSTGERIALASAIEAPAPAPPPTTSATPYIPAPKSRIAAALLAIFLGAFGIHKFYSNQAGMGVLYLLFFWTAIPALIGFIEGIIYLCMSDEAFAHKYG